MNYGKSKKLGKTTNKYLKTTLSYYFYKKGNYQKWEK